jgi:hypothetical protein
VLSLAAAPPGGKMNEPITCAMRALFTVSLHHNMDAINRQEKTKLQGEN